MDEGRLLERCRKGEEAVWEELVRCYWGLAYRIAYRILHHREEAEDAAQDAFVQFYRAIPSFLGQAHARLSALSSHLSSMAKTAAKFAVREPTDKPNSNRCHSGTAQSPRGIPNGVHGFSVWTNGSCALPSLSKKVR